MRHNEYLIRAIEDSISVKKAIINDPKCLETISKICDVFVDALRRGSKVLFAGNGGSAADAQHLAAELVSRLCFDRPGLPSMSLATDPSIVTAISNDYGFHTLFSRQIECHGRSGDVFVGITTSGKSINIINAFAAARKLGMVTVAFCGCLGDLDAYVDYVVKVPSKETPRIQECHILIGHMICTEAEERIFGEKEK
jgi:D-sedoheptulose 7-phosphate isomerase